MNILPLIFTFLIILSCLAFTFLREVKSTFLAETSFQGFNRTERVVNNAIVRKAYRKLDAETTTKKEPSHQKTKIKEYVSKRSGFPPLECSKFNLSPLIQHPGELKLHPLYEPLAEFLRILYKKPVFAKEPNADKIEYRLIDALIKKSKKLPEVKKISELYPDDPSLAKVFYKMLKGTNQYDIGGIPPLSDFFCFDKEGKAVSFCFASHFLLEALFGEEIAGLIMQKEKDQWSESKKYYYFSKEDLQAVLMKNPARGSSFSALEPHLNFSKKPAPRLQIGGRDNKTGIGIEKEIGEGL